MIKDVIQQTINQLFEKTAGVKIVDGIHFFKQIKASESTKVLAEKLMLTESTLIEFEEALRQYFEYRNDPEKSRISCFRVSLWLETICKRLSLPFSLDESISNEELAIKQVRALELIIRDLVNEKNGGKENVFLKLKDLFKQEIIEKWVKNADETGILSGTTFSELSNIFLDKNIFKGVEDIFDNSQLRLTKTSRESLRNILEDIRLIRNAVSHNKKISSIQIEALNTYYSVIAQMIKQSQSVSINPDQYLDLDKVKLENFITGLKDDTKSITLDIDEIKQDVRVVKEDVSFVKRRTIFIISGILLILILTGIVLYSVSKQSAVSDGISSDIKDVKEIVSRDAEIKNMTSTDDLKDVQDLNERTKDKNAKRIAILYFENSGGDPSLDKLKKGLADMIITDLSNVRMLDIVERDELESILKEQKLSNSSQFDPATAAKIGKLTGAEIILTGGYFELTGSIRIDARLIDVETGKILKSDGVDGKTTSFFNIQKQLSWKIINKLDTKLTDEEKQVLEISEKSRPISYEDLNEYSKALELYDKGNKTEAKKIIKILLSKYPEFLPAKNLDKKL